MSSSFSKVTYDGVQYVPLSEAKAAIERLEAEKVRLQHHAQSVIDDCCKAELEVERLRDALRYISTGRRHPTCPTCSDSREVAHAALEE